MNIIINSEWSQITEASLQMWTNTITERFGVNPFKHPNVTLRLNSSYWATLIQERKSTIPDVVAGGGELIWGRCDK